MSQSPQPAASPATTPSPQPAASQVTTPSLRRLRPGNPTNVLSIKLPDEVARVVRDLQAERGITATEVLRRGVALERFVTEQLDDGGKFLVQRPDGTLERVHFVFT